MSKIKDILIGFATNKKVLMLVKTGIVAGLTALGIAVTPEVTEVFCSTGQ